MPSREKSRALQPTLTHPVDIHDTMEMIGEKLDEITMFFDQVGYHADRPETRGSKLKHVTRKELVAELKRRARLVKW